MWPETYAHVDDHAVTLVSAHNGRDHHQRVFCDEVANASFPVACARGRRLQVEPQSLGGAGKEDDAADVLQQRSWRHHRRWR